MEIKGFKNVSYEELQLQLSKRTADTKESQLQIAVNLELKSISTIRNALDPERQLVSDQVLTNVMAAYGLTGFVLWSNGEKKYFLSNKN